MEQDLDKKGTKKEKEIIYANPVILGARFLGVRCFRSLDRCLIAKETTGDCETWVCI